MAQLCLKLLSWYWRGQTLKHLAWSQEHHPSLMQRVSHADYSLPHKAYITQSQPSHHAVWTWSHRWDILEGHVSLRLSVELWKQCSSVGGHVHLFLCLPPVADGAKSVTQHHVIHFRKGNMKCYRYFIVLEDWMVCLRLSETPREVSFLLRVWVNISCCGPIRLSGRYPTMLGVMIGEERAAEP